ncbi:MAG: AMP-binding protein [Lachnospiraceae bacterium]
MGNLPIIRNYYEMFCQIAPKRVALISEDIIYTYGKITRAAEEYRQRMATSRITGSKETSVNSCNPKSDNVSQKDISSGNNSARQLYYIQEEKIIDQLIAFLACQGTNFIPLFVPMDIDVETLKQTNPDIPEDAIMAVCTSGSRGIPKILFRDFSSWYNFFPIQNEIFHINENTRMFAQGSLAFTGNLNMYFAVFFAGGCMIADSQFTPKTWENLMYRHHANLIYLIPSKLMLLPRIIQKRMPDITMILSGSQSLGRTDACHLKTVFPNAQILLYYGASELSYITYVTDENMNEERNLIGKPFPGVEVFLREEELFVNTPYAILGVSMPFSVKDKGYQDADGNFYFSGRSDDIFGIRGRKIASRKIEDAINQIDGILDIAVCKCSFQHDEQLVAYVVPNPHIFSEKDIVSGCLIPYLSKTLAAYEIPKIWKCLASLPKTESGKTDLKKLESEN